MRVDFEKDFFSHWYPHVSLTKYPTCSYDPLGVRRSFGCDLTTWMQRIASVVAENAPSGPLLNDRVVVL